MISQTPFRPTCLSDLSDGTTVLVKWLQVESPVSEGPEPASLQAESLCLKGLRDVCAGRDPVSEGPEPASLQAESLCLKGLSRHLCRQRACV